MTRKLEFSLADWNNPNDCQSVLALLQAYALHPMGGAEPLSDYCVQNLPQAMAATPGAFSVIAWQVDNDGKRCAVALANCFSTLSTFACKPLINIHDLYVSDAARGQGTGQAIMGFVEKEARSRGCCKVTLEVLSGNSNAISSYKQFGFIPYTMDDTNGHALFMHKKLD
ncbi:MAG: GNAT family N-acetyltransferase [Granulosicoccus sp.]